jgi:hypothetical protein
MVARTMGATLRVPEDTLDAAWLYRERTVDLAAPADASANPQAQVA